MFSYFALQFFNVVMAADACIQILKMQEIPKFKGFIRPCALKRIGCRQLDSFIENYEYKKNDASVYKMLTTIGNEDLAKRYAERLRSFFEGDEDYKEHKPCTTVDLLVSELESPEKLL